jgi:putative ABC transport system substrate-binding protein
LDEPIRATWENNDDGNHRPRRRHDCLPIVFTTGDDPVKIGLVASLNRPGGNATGIGNLAVELAARRLGLLRELLPGAALFGALVNPDNPISESFVKELRMAASTSGRQIEVVTARTNAEIDAA